MASKNSKVTFSSILAEEKKKISLDDIKLSSRAIAKQKVPRDRLIGYLGDLVGSRLSELIKKLSEAKDNYGDGILEEEEGELTMKILDIETPSEHRRRIQKLRREKRDALARINATKRWEPIKIRQLAKKHGLKIED